MSIIPTPRRQRNDYPTSDGKPMAETELHRELMYDLIHSLEFFFESARRVCVSGNLLLFYEKGNRRRHVSPDVFVVRGVAKRRRDNYLMWEEGKGPDFVIEVTSSSTRKEDMTTKRILYRDTLRVKEYFLFDPTGDYLNPRLQGYRLLEGEYEPIEAIDGRLPSQEVKLHLEAAGNQLRLWNPRTGAWIPTLKERAAAEAEARQQAEAEVARLRALLEQRSHR